MTEKTVLPRLVDAHAHLEDIPNIDEEIARAGEAGVIAIVAVGMDEKSNEAALEISCRHQGLVFPALGLHPWNLQEDFAPVLESMERKIDGCVAVGEVGLDFKMQKPKELQVAAFRGVLELAKKHGKPVIVHSRWAWSEAFDIVKEVGVGRVIFHWYSGPMDILREILDLGHLVSATPAVEYSEYHRPVVAEVPLSQLVLETDSPVVYRGRPSRPADVAGVLRAVAKLKGESEERVAEATTENAAKLFNFEKFQ
ncbi:MAG: TatD family hydrolase [Candidatus Hadarchaeota archaeon]